jgi:class 3 adenylate cyclase/tetratricopeptide (TPR) repeat protein
MGCARCGNELREGARFCDRCGAPVGPACARCETLLRPGARFCDQCGAPVTAAPVPAPQFDAPRAYTPRHLAEKILTSRAALEGERKQVTVLFADLHNFTALAEQLDPEELHDLMNRVFDILLAEVHRFEGTVNQFTGDGIMALFGAPLALEDHAARAVEAALAVQAAMEKVGDEVERSRGRRIALRIGLNTGLVVVGKIGDDLRMDYTAQGDTVNLAARLQALAEPGTVAMSQATHRLVSGYFDCVALGPHTLKGKSAPVEVFRPLRRQARRSRLAVASEAGLTAFVGREAELGALQGAWEEARAGRGRVVTIVGEAGVGKSRLLWELRKRVEARGGAWVEGTCVPYGQSTPYLPVTDLVRALLGFAEADPEREMDKKLTERLGVLGLDAVRLGPALRFFLSIGSPDAALTGLSPQERKERLLEALRELAGAAARETPHVFALENCQWLDAASADFLAAASPAIPRWPALVILTHRPGAAVALGDSPVTTRILLRPLEGPEREAMLRAALGDTPLRPELLAAVAEKTGGNPLFMEEVARAVREADPSGGAQALRIPPTILDVLSARIDRLPEGAKAALQMASVIGRDFTQRLLARVADRGEAIPSALAKLLELEMIIEKSREESLYMFRQALVQEVAYQSLLVQRRKALHRLIGEAVEEVYGDRLSEHVEMLAHHFLQGEAWAKAVGYLRQAGARAAGLGANAEAVAFLERALEANRRLPESRERDARAIDLSIDLRPPLLQLGRLEEVLAVSREAEALARRLGDEQRLARVYAYLVNYHYLKGEPDQATLYGQRCLAIGERTGDLALQALALQYMGTCAHARGRYPEAIATLGRNIELIEAHEGEAGITRGGFAYVASSGWLAFALSELGDFGAARAALDKARGAAAGSGHPYGEAIAWTFAGLVKSREGDLAGAVPDLERSLALCRERGLHVWRPIPSSILGHALVRLGRVGEGLPLLEEGVALTERLGVRAYLALWTAHRAEGLLAAGDLPAAREAALRALELARAHKEEGHRARALRLLGDLWLRLDPPDPARAEAAYREAADLAARLEMAPLSAECRALVRG